MAVITRDVDLISHEAEGIMANANELLEDVNGKVATIDPLFQAVADLSESTSDLNQATRRLAGRVNHTGKSKNTGKVATAMNVGKGAMNMYKNHKVKNK